jgi:NAD(P)H-dependent flavin oxidoreductase YrpB (nitropropane dioxygenase family)
MTLTVSTRACELLGITKPIILAGMGAAASPALAAAVSNAGGLGVIGAADLEPDRLNNAIDEVRKATSQPFGVDTLIPSGNPETLTLDDILERIPAAYIDAAREIRQEYGLPDIPMPRLRPWFSKDFYRAQMDVILDQRVPVYAAGLGNPGPFVDRLHQHGTTVIGLVGNVRNARSVADGGADAVVAQGYDAGGHTGNIGTLSLVPSVVAAVGDRVPVIAAGGISTGRALLAILALGAGAAWIGTRFLATEEAGLPRGQRDQLLGLGSDDLTMTKYRTGKQAHIVRTPVFAEFERRGLPPLRMPEMRFLADLVFDAAESAGRYDLAPSFAGQGIFALSAIQKAADVVNDLMADLEAGFAQLNASARQDTE